MEAWVADLHTCLQETKKLTNIKGIRGSYPRAGRRWVREGSQEESPLGQRSGKVSGNQQRRV